MNNRFKVKLLVASIIAADVGISSPAFAEKLALEEIIVTARRKDESVQDVPLSVNGVTSEQLQDLNLRKFEDLSSLVAGLTLQDDSIAPTASVRGVRFETFANAGSSVEFYLNDAPSTSLSVMQNMFDVARVEVLRGPQGTLRGRASPSGSITVSTAAAETDVFLGYIDTTATADGDTNINAAVNIPLIEDKLGIRVAGFWEENDINNVTSAYGFGGSEYKGDGYRVSMTAQPTESLYINAMYQRVEPRREIFFPAESAAYKDPTLAVPNPDLRAEDRRSVQDVAEVSEQTLETTTLNVSWDFAEQHQLNYVGSYRSDLIERTTPIDRMNAVDDSYPAAFQGAAQELYTDNDAYTHELRIQSTIPLFDRIDYVAGYLMTKSATTIQYNSPQFIYLPGLFEGIFNTSITNEDDGKQSPTREESYFANLTYHLSDETEISGGLRSIHWEAIDYLEISNTGTILDDDTRTEEDTVYMASIKHNFTYDVMAYATWGTSWRYGANAIGELSTVKSDLQQQLLKTPPETSESIELGVKSIWLDQRLRVNAAVYHQTFEDFALRSASGVYYRYVDANGNESVGNPFNFVSPVPVTVNGIEIDTTYVISENWDAGVLFSYSKGEVDDAPVACNDYSPNDGAPDSGGTVPTLGEIVAAAGDDNLTTCQSSERTDYAPLWTATLSSEYTMELGAVDAYIRGLWTFYDESENDPANTIDDVSAYDILSLYIGVREPSRRWEAMLFVKNVLDTEKVLSRNRTPGSQSFTGAPSAVSDYREVELTTPREVGVNIRYNF